MTNNVRKIKTMDALDKAIMQNQMRIRIQESNISHSFMRAREFYSPQRLLQEGLNYAYDKISNITFSLGEIITPIINLFVKKDKK